MPEAVEIVVWLSFQSLAVEQIVVFVAVAVAVPSFSAVLVLEEILVTLHKIRAANVVANVLHLGAFDGSVHCPISTAVVLSSRACRLLFQRRLAVAVVR